MRTDEFDYRLPEGLIAQEPSPDGRGASRMLVLDCSSGGISIGGFQELHSHLRHGDCVAVNNTKVMKARLIASKDSGASIEIFLLRRDASRNGVWSCLMRPAKRVAAGSTLKLLDRSRMPSQWSVRLLEKDAEGGCLVEMLGGDGDDAMENCGHVPLPPYIKRSDSGEDVIRYQTVFAKEPGAVAAPTAGLHLSPEDFKRFEENGVVVAETTLHVGIGTFRPVSSELIEDHKMHSEEFSLSEVAAETLNRTRLAGGRVLAIGTTSLRVLETCVGRDRLFSQMSGSTDIFIRPPMAPESSDMLLTNFHLPKSSLLMLVSAFARDKGMVMDAYQCAMDAGMRFFSYGDCMLLKR